MISKEILRKGFLESKEYYKMIEEWHKEHDGLAIEPITKEKLIKILNSLPRKSKVLDIGCGEGSITIWFAKRYPHLCFIGTDISPYGIELAKRKSQNIENIQFLVDDIESSKLGDKYISLIISQSVLEHLTNYKKALVECFRILVCGGRLLIRVGNAGRAKGFVRGLLGYLLKLNKPILKTPTFDLSGNTMAEKRTKLRSNFDLVEIPSDVLLHDLRKIGFEIDYFTTNKQSLLLSERYKKGNYFTKKFIKIYIKFNIFPFNHMGYTTILVAMKK